MVLEFSSGMLLTDTKNHVRLLVFLARVLSTRKSFSCGSEALCSASRSCLWLWPSVQHL